MGRRGFWRCWSEGIIDQSSPIHSSCQSTGPWGWKWRPDVSATRFSPLQSTDIAQKPRLNRDQPEDAAALLRRHSSSGRPFSSAKRKAVFVPPLTHIFLRLAKLVYDSNIVVSSAARATILYMRRNKPALLTRPIFDYLSGENKDIQLASDIYIGCLITHKTRSSASLDS